MIRYFILYLILINTAAFILYGIDKKEPGKADGGFLKKYFLAWLLLEAGQELLPE